MNLQVNGSKAFTQLPANRAAAQQSAPAPAPAAPEASKDSVSFGRGLLATLGGTGAGLVGSTAAAAAITLIAEKGIPKDFGGYVAVGGAVGGAGALVGGAASAIFTDSPASGTVAGAVSGGLAGAALMGKSLGTVGAAVLGGVLGAIGGGIGGYTAAKIKH